jgi:hypothetical protein
MFGFDQLLTLVGYIFHVKIQLFVTFKFDQDPKPDPHWFGSLEPNPHWNKKLVLRIKKLPIWDVGTGTVVFIESSYGTSM